MAEAKKKTFDVERPGKAAPSATSKPVIVGHGPMLQDPMVQTADKPDAEAEKPKTITHEKKLEAPATLVEASTAEAEPAAETEPTQASEVAAAKAAAPDEQPAAESTESNDEAVVDSVAEQAGDKKAEEQANKEAADRQALVSGLVEEKKYFVPINVAKRRSHRTTLMVLLLVVLVAAGGAAAYITGLISLDI